jgi:hypothetical protein
MRPAYFFGLDLAQTTDYTALAAVERPPQTPLSPAGDWYALRHLQRFALGTPQAPGNFQANETDVV